MPFFQEKLQMNNLKLFLFMSFACMAFTVNAKDMIKVYDQGSDGNQRIYTVICPDKSHASVVQTFDAEAKVIEVCIQPAKREGTCLPAWDLQEAAKASCR